MRVSRSCVLFTVILLILVILFGCVKPTTTNETEETEETTEMSDKRQYETLTFDSFDGGGPSYSLVTDSDIFEYYSEQKYNRADHAEIDGAGFEVIYHFKGLKTGVGRFTIEERSPIAFNVDHYYKITVGTDLSVAIVSMGEKDLDAPEDPEELPEATCVMVVKTEERTLYAHFNDSLAAEILIYWLEPAEYVAGLEDCPIGKRLHSEPVYITDSKDGIIKVKPGDIYITNGDTIIVCLKSGEAVGELVAHMEYKESELVEAFKSQSVSLSLEWSE